MRSMWSKFKLEMIVLIALLGALSLHGYITHPGVHVAGALLLLDVLVLRISRRHYLAWRISWLCILNLIGFWAIKFSPDSIELGVVGVLGLILIGILLFGVNENTQ